MRITRTTAPASAAQLQATAANLRTEITGLQAEEVDRSAALPDLVGDPAFEQNEARLRELPVLIPTKRRTLALVEADIPKAERRERVSAVGQRLADFERRTEKLARKAPKLYRELAGPLTELLHELDANGREHDVLFREAQELGLQASLGHSAEVRARIDLPGSRIGGIYHSVLTDTKISNWESSARPLFDAGLIRRR